MIILKTNKNPLHDLEFVEPVKKIIGGSKVLSLFEDNLKEKIKEGEKVIITGTSLQDNEFINHYRKLSFIKEKNISVLGICAGMQLLAKIYGCKRTKNTSIGVKEIKITREDPLIKTKKGETLKVYSLHNYSIEPNTQIEVIAKSEYPEIIKIKGKKQYGVGFHPEVLNQEIIRNFVKM